MAYLDGHLIVEFAMKRWSLTKKDIAEFYEIASQSRLSRAEPLSIEPWKYYNKLFDIENPESAAATAKENEKGLLEAFEDFLIRKDCKRDADYICNKRKNEKAKYKDIMFELFKRASVQPSIDVEKITTPQQAEIPLPSSNEMSAAQMRKIFIKAAKHFGVMDIINRRPAILYRADSLNLEAFAGQIGELFIYRNIHAKDDPVIFASIKNFYEKIMIQAMSIDHYLNTRFGTDDESGDLSVFINLEENAQLIEPQNTSYLAEMPKLTLDLVSEAVNPMRLLNTVNKDWGNVRNKLNLLYDEITSVAR